jgi:hypothetical protein
MRCRPDKEKEMQMVTDFTIRIADCNILVKALYPSTKEFCQDYLTDAPAELTVTISPDDIVYEREKSAREDETEGIAIRYFSDEYLETLAVYRKMAAELLDHHTLLFHGSAIAVDGKGYLFTAKSGTGKSTHTRLWREYFQERSIMINDDKPLLKITDSGVLVYGTPWDGKHRLSSNISVPLKAICVLERDTTNHIESISAREALPMLLQQSYRPKNPEKLMKTLSLVDRLRENVKLYRLGCTMDPTAAQVAYDGMNESEE